MGETTAISWTDHTFNPWMGCTKVSPACDHCYAEALGKRTGKVQWGDDAQRVITSDGYWRNPLKWNRAAEAAGERHRVFCASLADVFEDRPELNDVRARLWELVYASPHLDWQLLTKRPENVLRMVPETWWHDDWAGDWPPNVWIGTTIEDQERAEERLPHLMGIPAPVRFVSCEPLLGPLDISDWLDECDIHHIDWVIVGGESGAGHRPLDLDDARLLRDSCVARDIPFFFKQIGGRTPTAGGNLLDGQEWHQFPRAIDKAAVDG